MPAAISMRSPSRLGGGAAGHDPKGIQAQIIEAMTTNESFFFRDDKPFTHFRNQALPALLAARTGSARLRIWSAAAGSGQEAYSLAMILAECRAQVGGRGIEIVGTDLAAEPLVRARAGIYTQFEVQRGLPMQILVKYFTKDGTNWRIDEKLRAMAQFREWNLLADLRPLGMFDVVFCRNVLIYFDQPTKAARAGGDRPPDGAGWQALSRWRRDDPRHHRSAGTC